jgi:hypothetical protein
MHLPNSKNYFVTYLEAQIPIRLDLRRLFKVTRFRQLAPNRGVVKTFTAATDMIKFLYYRNNILQKLHELPHPEPGHTATAAFDYYLGELSALARHGTGQLTYYAQSNAHWMTGSGVMTM